MDLSELWAALGMRAFPVTEDPTCHGPELVIERVKTQA